MSQALALLRLLPWPFFGRLAIAFTEITLSVFLICSSVVLGHELKAWREWFYDPATVHPWAPTPKPSPTALAAVASASLSPTPAPAVTPIVWAVAWPDECQPAGHDEQLIFINKVGTGADCVRTIPKPDGVHLVVETYPAAITDLGIVTATNDKPSVRVFAPVAWPDPVLVIRSTWAGNVGSAVVVTWRSREPTRLLGVIGEKVDVGTGSGGWPRLTVTGIDGARRVYVWTGSAFSAQ